MISETKNNDLRISYITGWLNNLYFYGLVKNCEWLKSETYLQEYFIFARECCVNSFWENMFFYLTLSFGRNLFILFSGVFASKIMQRTIGIWT